MNPYSLNGYIGQRLRLETPQAPDLSREYAAWSKDALCLGFPAEMFDGEGKGASSMEAKAICGQCPVIEQCLEEALRIERNESYSHGVRGGRSANERRRMIVAERAAEPARPKRKRNVAPCGTPAAYARHIRHHEPICDACRAAESLRNAERREGAA